MYPHNAVPRVGGGGGGGVLVGGGGREVAAGVQAVPVTVPLVPVLLVHQPRPAGLEDMLVDIRPPGRTEGQTGSVSDSSIITCVPVHPGTLSPRSGWSSGCL